MKMQGKKIASLFLLKKFCLRISYFWLRRTEGAERKNIGETETLMTRYKYLSSYSHYTCIVRCFIQGEYISDRFQTGGLAQSGVRKSDLEHLVRC